MFIGHIYYFFIVPDMPWANMPLLRHISSIHSRYTGACTICYTRLSRVSVPEVVPEIPLRMILSQIQTHQNSFLYYLRLFLLFNFFFFYCRLILWVLIHDNGFHTGGTLVYEGLKPQHGRPTSGSNTSAPGEPSAGMEARVSSQQGLQHFPSAPGSHQLVSKPAPGSHPLVSEPRPWSKEQSKEVSHILYRLYYILFPPSWGVGHPPASSREPQLQTLSRLGPLPRHKVRPNSSFIWPNATKIYCFFF